MKRLSYSKEDFAWTQWDAPAIRAVAAKALASKKEAYEKIKNIPAGERTFANTIAAIEASNQTLSPTINYIEWLMNVSPDTSVREAAKAAIDAFEKEIVDIEYDENLYQAVKEYAAHPEDLQGADKKLLDDMVRGYRRMGFEILREKREELKTNLKKLSELSTVFLKNINDYQDSIMVTREELVGLTDSYIARLKCAEDGRYKISLDYPEIVPFMKNSPLEEKRRELALKNLQKGGEENMKTLLEMVRLRRENAKLLGYKSHPDFQTELRMVKNGEVVFRFLDRLSKEMKPLTKKDVEELTALKRELTGDSNAKIEYHDVAFYINEAKKRSFEVDDEKIREYFPLKNVKKGMLKIYSRLFSVSFEKLEGYPLWHEDVELYAVKNQNRDTLAYFFLDLYPRENKYGHAAVFPLIKGCIIRDGNETTYIAPLCGMATNFPKPVADNPSLLSHAEVETFFHEFGHAIHNSLTEAPYAAQSGTNVAADFVETPSQMLENWLWEKEPLDILSRHYQTGEKLPKELLESMLRAKNHMIGYIEMRQLVLGLFDYTIHASETNIDINQTFKDIFEKLLGIALPETGIFPAGFGHMAGGYDAGYYGYMWSKVYSSDMFTRFKDEGLLNPKTGADYRNWILAKGSSIDEMELVRGFLGREPNEEAFLREIGLKTN